ncbi:hypothetical protein HDU97_008247 [Phlyctochytrium planicorne]|nr:hypothetical protein HDU97_008247 [Phlyctochytrium planicorne]
MFLKKRRQQNPLELKEIPNPANSFSMNAIHPTAAHPNPFVKDGSLEGRSQVAPPAVQAVPHQNSFQGSGNLWSANSNAQGTEKLGIQSSSGGAQVHVQNGGGRTSPPGQLYSTHSQSSQPAWSEKQALAQNYGIQNSGSSASQGISAFPVAAAEKQAVAQTYQMQGSASQPSQSISAFPNASAEKRALAQTYSANTPAPASTSMPASVPSNVASWSSDEVSNALTQAGASPFAVRVLRDNNVNGFGLLVLDLRSLVALGFNDMNAQQVLNVINIIRAGEGISGGSGTEAPPQYF